MKELVTTEQATRVLFLLALSLPIAGLVIGGVVGLRRGRARRGLGIGLLIGHTGPLTFVLWKVYNAIMGRYGLDSVKGLLINLALFVAVGLVLGMVVGWRLRRQAAASPQETAPTRGG
jgi:hypothetical protein